MPLQAGPSSPEKSDRACRQRRSSSALDSILDGSPQREVLIDRHADKPMTPTNVSMEMMVSAVWWSVEIRYELPGQRPYSERLLVHHAVTHRIG
jgi:hypothetical protein